MAAARLEMYNYYCNQKTDGATDKSDEPYFIVSSVIFDAAGTPHNSTKERIPQEGAFSMQVGDHIGHGGNTGPINLWRGDIPSRGRAEIEVLCMDQDGGLAGHWFDVADAAIEKIKDGTIKTIATVGVIIGKFISGNNMDDLCGAMRAVIHVENDQGSLRAEYIAQDHAVDLGMVATGGRNEMDFNGDGGQYKMVFGTFPG